MRLDQKYWIYGVAGDPFTERLLKLARQKGVSLALKDLRTDNRAQLDFQGRGHSRHPIVVLDGKPAFTYVGDFNTVLEMLTALPDSIGGELVQSGFTPAPAGELLPQDGNTETGTPAISEIVGDNPIPTDHGPTAEVNAESPASGDDAAADAPDSTEAPAEPEPAKADTGHAEAAE